MLILTRKRDDSIRIGDDIIVHVMRTGRGSVKIGIEAPETVRIVRGELFAANSGAAVPCRDLHSAVETWDDNQIGSRQGTAAPLSIGELFDVGTSAMSHADDDSHEICSDALLLQH